MDAESLKGPIVPLFRSLSFILDSAGAVCYDWIFTKLYRSPEKQHI